MGKSSEMSDLRRTLPTSSLLDEIAFIYYDGYSFADVRTAISARAGGAIFPTMSNK